MSAPRDVAAPGGVRAGGRGVGVVSGHVVKLARASVGLTQERLAERLGVDACTVQGWESGRRPLSATSVASLLTVSRRLRELGADSALVEAIGLAVEADCVLAALLRDEPLRPDAERRAVMELVRWPLTSHAPGWLPLARRRLAAALSEAGAA
jgi:transcriptional regulator with XRE-family HTH domain